MTDPFDLQRFVDAQDPVFEQVCRELADGRKRSHWMWFIFPQLRGLGHSPTAVRFAISGRAEAAAYLQHPLLGARLDQCCRLVSFVQGRTAEQIFGYPDTLKLQSSMTLFAQAAPSNPAFPEILQKYFAGSVAV